MQTTEVDKCIACTTKITLRVVAVHGLLCKEYLENGMSILSLTCVWQNISSWSHVQALHWIRNLIWDIRHLGDGQQVVYLRRKTGVQRFDAKLLFFSLYEELRIWVHLWI